MKQIDDGVKKVLVKGHTRVTLKGKTCWVHPYYRYFRARENILDRKQFIRQRLIPRRRGD